MKNQINEIESDNFISFRDYVFVSADKEKNARKTIAPGVEIVIDQRFNPHNRGVCTQDGVIEYVPTKLTTKQKVEIVQGDRVYFHHFVLDDDNRVIINDKLLYNCQYESLYCKVVGDKIIMLSDYNLVEAIPEEKSSIIITPDSAKVNSKTRGIMRHMNIRMEEMGVCAGETVLFQKDADMDIDVEGKTYFVIDNKHIVAKVETK